MNATCKEEGESNKAIEQYNSCERIRLKPIMNLQISKNNFDKSDSEDDTEPETAKHKTP